MDVGAGVEFLGGGGGSGGEWVVVGKLEGGVGVGRDVGGGAEGDALLEGGVEGLGGEEGFEDGGRVGVCVGGGSVSGVGRGGWMFVSVVGRAYRWCRRLIVGRPGLCW